MHLLRQSCGAFHPLPAAIDAVLFEIQIECLLEGDERGRLPIVGKLDDVPVLASIDEDDDVLVVDGVALDAAGRHHGVDELRDDFFCIGGILLSGAVTLSFINA